MTFWSKQYKNDQGEGLQYERNIDILGTLSKANAQAGIFVSVSSHNSLDMLVSSQY